MQIIVIFPVHLPELGHPWDEKHFKVPVRTVKKTKNRVEMIRTTKLRLGRTKRLMKLLIYLWGGTTGSTAIPMERESLRKSSSCSVTASASGRAAMFSAKTSRLSMNI